MDTGSRSTRIRRAWAWATSSCRLAAVMRRLDSTPGIEHVLVHTGQNWDHQLNGVFFDEMGLRLPDHVLDVDVSSLGATLGDIRATGVQVVTIGQYLQPTPKHLPVDRYVHPDEFAAHKEYALELGFLHCEAGPLVRSSYHAHEHVPPGQPVPTAAG